MDAGAKVIKIGGHRAVVTYSARGYITVKCAGRAVIHELLADDKRIAARTAAAWTSAMTKLELAAIAEMRQLVYVLRKP